MIGNQVTDYKKLNFDDYELKTMKDTSIKNINDYNISKTEKTNNIGYKLLINYDEKVRYIKFKSIDKWGNYDFRFIKGWGGLSDDDIDYLQTTKTEEYLKKQLWDRDQKKIYGIHGLSTFTIFGKKICGNDDIKIWRKLGNNSSEQTCQELIESKINKIKTPSSENCFYKMFSDKDDQKSLQEIFRDDKLGSKNYQFKVNLNDKILIKTDIV